MQAIRHIASRDRNRYNDRQYDLDLSYILPNVIAMGFPGDCQYLKMYSNNVEDVARFLDETHGNHYHVFNLCAEKSYPARYFHDRVTRYRIIDFNPPPLEMMREFCDEVDRWLSRDPRNVIVVHCHAGKGRTGTMISAYLLYKRMFTTAEQAIEFFHNKRMMPGMKAMRPSQCRYVRYFARLIRERFVYSPKPLVLLAVEFTECPAVNGFLASPYFKLKQRGIDSSYKSPVFKTDTRRRMLMELPLPVRVAGDFKIEFYDKQGPGKMVLFYIWLNTYFVSSSLSAPSTGGPASRPSSDQWCPVPSKSGTRQDGSDLGMRCFVSMVGVSDDGGGGRCITVSLPRTELDRIGQPRVEDMVRSDFTMKLYFSPLPSCA